MENVLICDNSFCNMGTADSGAERCACGALLRPLAKSDFHSASPSSGDSAAVNDGDNGWGGESITAHGIDAYRRSWLERLESYWPVGVFIGPTGAGKSSLLNLALGWPALWGRSGSHTTRCPAILENHRKRIVSCGNERAGLEYLCEPRSANRSETPSIRNIDERLRFISGQKISGGLRDKFWRSFEEQFADWHRTGITGDVYVRVSSPIPGIPDGAVLIDAPGFDGAPDQSDPEAFRLERDLAAATDFWSDTADVAVFVFELEGLNREGEAARLARRLKRGKPSAVFFNKLDRLDLFQHGLVNGGPEEMKAVWGRYREARLQKLRDEGLEGCEVFFGFSAFDSNGKPPSGPVAREWSEGTAKLFEWTRRSLRQIKK